MALLDRPWVVPAAWAVALLAAVSPLWVTAQLPLVDLPQHLHLISVLHRLDDPTTLYPQVFVARGELTPYLGYYYLVSLLGWLFPLELANRLFLSAYVAGLPAALAFLLVSLGRPAWPALLAVPFAWGDSFAWGFINFCAALPLAFLTAGFFVRALEDPARRRTWAIATAISLTAVLLFHVQVFAFLGLALPWLLLTSPPPERTLRARVPAVVGVIPGVVLFILWVGLRVGQPQEIAPGQPWRSWGPMLSPQNLGWKSTAQNLADLVSSAPGQGLRFPVLAGQLADGSDHLAVLVVLVLAAAGTAVGLWRRAPLGPRLASLRMPGLAVIAFILFFALPFDIRGYMYYLNTRFAHLGAALLVASIPVVPAVWQRRGLIAAAGAAVLFAWPMVRAFRGFDAESAALAQVAGAAADRPRVMGLIFDTRSAYVTHPVYLHAAAVVARQAGGLTNFSFALTPHSPVRYQGAPPPTFASEWRPDTMSWEQHGRHYDHFVVRGVDPRQLFGPKLDGELTLAARAGDFFLVRRR